jgi:intein/homing endonuclease
MEIPTEYSPVSNSLKYRSKGFNDTEYRTPLRRLYRRNGEQAPRGKRRPHRHKHSVRGAVVTFTYSGKPQDVGNNGSTVDIRAGRFALNMRFVVAGMARVLKPGCNACIHIQQLLSYKNQHGFMGRRDFRGAMVEVFTAPNGHGEPLNFTGEFVIPKDPQLAAQKLSLHSLQFKTGVSRNGCMLMPFVNDYVLIFQKPGTHSCPPRPLFHPKKNPTGWMTTDEWVRDASGIWSDVIEIDVLDGARGAKEHGQEKHVCLAKGSLVLTYDGHKPIEEVQIGDLVLTHRGRWRPVLNRQFMGRRSVIRTTAQGVADLRTTSEHELWTRNSGTANPCYHRTKAKNTEPAWIPAYRTLSSYINLKLPPMAEKESPYSLHDWWVVGRWLGDGHFDSRDRAHISIGHFEADAIIDKLGVRAGAATHRRTSTQVAINDRGGKLRDLLKRCGRGAGGKKLPGEALELDEEYSEALLSGYLSADGHYVAKHERWTASSVSRALMLGMAMVAQRARNVVASVYAGRDAGMAIIEGRTVNTRQDWVLTISPRNISGFISDDGAWKKVRSITDDGISEVWDLQVEEDESFTAEGCIVHNCPLQLSVIQRCVQLYTNPISIQTDVTVLDPFMGIGSTAYVCAGGKSPVTKERLAEPRNVVGFELKESYHKASLHHVGKVIAASNTSPEAVLFEMGGALPRKRKIKAPPVLA